MEIVQLSDRQKHLIRTTWNTVSGELAQSLSYVGSGGDKTMEDSDHQRSEAEIVSEPFLKLFEEYPMSQQFFVDFRGTPVEALRDDKQLSIKLQEHAIRVLRVVEKVIGRLEDLEKVLFMFLLHSLCISCPFSVKAIFAGSWPLSSSCWHP